MKKDRLHDDHLDHLDDFGLVRPSRYTLPSPLLAGDGSEARTWSQARGRATAGEQIKRAAVSLGRSELEFSLAKDTSAGLD